MLFSKSESSKNLLVKKKHVFSTFVFSKTAWKLLQFQLFYHRAFEEATMIVPKRHPSLGAVAVSGAAI